VEPKYAKGKDHDYYDSLGYSPLYFYWDQHSLYAPDEDITEGISNINELVEETDKMMENVNGVLDENTDAVTDTVKKLNEIDFDSLNEAIKNLNDVVKPLSDFFKGFGR
ncbi:MAG: hypothetical protein II036_03610, partial [Oscillospiraceae bacterium]|nr:hypothetical protein [Oscillospiraceae bacterium]